MIQLILELVLLVIASISDIRKLEVSTILTFFLPFIFRTGFLLYFKDPYSIFYAVVAIIVFIIFAFAAIFSSFGGADVLVCAMIAYYMGIRGLYAIVIAFLLSIPFLLYQQYIKKTNMQNFRYPFVPFLTIGYFIVFLFFFL